MNEGRKWTFFIVQSVPLVNQQANSLRKHLPWTIGTFSGDMNVDLWSQDHWDNILKRCHVSTYYYLTKNDIFILLVLLYLPATITTMPTVIHCNVVILVLFVI